ncbi:hypothetical protein [Geomesophilobacter sediminis]|uniref:Fibronectin type-III domain-containing protein n=1 Tax=Geomesophilobacter sediminis TaxID=2798584 RepID=A0A8J7JME7_9BACT|nr:hypothetical protein [Geomesophilobacter sediminis]MBJ6725765.1 hypothetical protein [Geomesophilobacter sediminis]
MDIRLRVSFPKTSTTKKIARLKYLLAQIQGSPFIQEPFPPGYASTAELADGIAALEKADIEAKTMDRVKIAYRNKLDDQITNKFKKLARHFEVVADGNLEALQSTGFPLAKAPGRRNTKIGLMDPPPLSLKKGSSAASLLLAWKKIAGACLEAHSTSGDPTVEENWGSHGLFSGPRAELTGFTLGQFYFLRVRIVNEAGAGVWSAPYQFLAT